MESQLVVVEGKRNFLCAPVLEELHGNLEHTLPWLASCYFVVHPMLPIVHQGINGQKWKQHTFIHNILSVCLRTLNF